jgi:rod shape determining protein RodA
MAIPMVLILKQPDLGTSLVLMSIWFGMLYIAGARVKHLALILAVGALMAFVAWHVPGVLKDYQKARLTSFINPEADPRGSGYHIKQSRIAIGSGQFTGKGLFKGTQSQLRFIPEQHTDFIFTIVGEEIGFLGSSILMLLYFGLMWRGASILSETEDYLGRLIAAGILSMFLFHILVNLGMTMGIMPVTGVPLPLFSYGGSNMLANLTAIGLLMGIYVKRHKIAF